MPEESLLEGFTATPFTNAQEKLRTKGGADNTNRKQHFCRTLQTAVKLLCWHPELTSPT